MSPPDTIVVGLGSIGQRHARLLTELGRIVATVSRRSDGDHREIETALTAAPDYVVIANETSQHGTTLATLSRAGYSGRVLVEKPLLAAPGTVAFHGFAELAVGYQLRFHPVLRRVRESLGDAEALSAVAFVGQYLPDWRPSRDYRTTASATAERGGGVLRDLSHELDYLLWLFGPWRRVAAVVRRTGTLEITSDDIVAVLIDCERCPAISLHMDYHFRPRARVLTVVTAEHSYSGDFIAGLVECDGRQERLPVDRDEPYREMHRAVLTGQPGFCRATDGLAVVDLIAAIERAAAEEIWVTR